jgi:hypothetical protein
MNLSTICTCPNTQTSAPLLSLCSPCRQTVLDRRADPLLTRINPNSNKHVRLNAQRKRNKIDRVRTRTSRHDSGAAGGFQAIFHVLKVANISIRDDGNIELLAEHQRILNYQSTDKKSVTRIAISHRTILILLQSARPQNCCFCSLVRPWTVRTDAPASYTKQIPKQLEISNWISKTH